MYLLFSHTNDPVAVWMAQHLPPLLPEELIWITDVEIASTRRFELRLGNEINEARLALRDGQRIDSSTTSGVINRLAQPVTTPLAHMRTEDRDYAWQEMAAFTLGWLSAFTCPVINRPSPNSFSGRMRSPIEWDGLARQAGLPLDQRAWTSRQESPSPAISASDMWLRAAEPGQSTASVFVVGSRVIGTSEATFLENARMEGPLLILAELADTSLLEVVFARNSRGGWSFHHVEPMPDLRRAGSDGLFALRDLLAPTISPTLTHAAS